MWRPPLALLLAAASAVVPACSTDANRDGPEGAEQATADEAAPRCDREIDAALRAWSEAGFSGTIAISTGGEPDCLAAYGRADEANDTPNTVDTVFSIGSVSKAFAAAAVLDLVDAGRLSLTDRAGDVVEGLSGAAAGVTVEQLLVHTSGLDGSHGEDHQPLGRDEAVAAIGQLELAFEPGSDYLYTNAGYTLLALMVEAASGQSYRDYLASEILSLPGGASAGGFWDGEPAVPGPRAVGYLDDGPDVEPTDQMGDFGGPHWALAGNGDLAMTMADLASWTHALFAGDLVGPRAGELLSSVRFDHGDGAVEVPGWVALDASVLGEPVVTASGGGGDIGHNAVVAWFPDSERTIALASNTPDVTAGALLQAVGPALVAGDPLPRPEVVEDVDPAEADAVAGTYELGTGGSFEVTSSRDRLAVSARDADAVAALFPLPEDVTADDVAAHERDVRALLAGETQAGREERAAIESEIGPIGAVELAGTVDDGGELHTYVTVSPADPADDPVLLWYSLDDQGGVGAVELGAEPPSLLLGRAPDGGYRPDDPTGTGPDVTVAFDQDRGGRMTVTGTSGTTTARLAG